MALANDATPRSAQGEVDPASLLRLRIADLPRLFFFARIKSNQGFFTTSTSFVERRKALLLPASIFFRPAVVLPLLSKRLPWGRLLPLLPGTPWAPLLPLLPGAPLLLPRLPGTPPPRNAFRCALASDAFALKQVMQNFARVEAASFVHPGVLHADRASS